MTALLLAAALTVQPDIDLPLHSICASGNEILCIDRSLSRYAVLEKQLFRKGRVHPHWRHLNGAFLHAEPLSPIGFALLYRRSKAGVTYANLIDGRLTESLIPAAIVDAKNDVASYVGRDGRGRPYACFDGVLPARMLRFDKTWKEVGNPYLIGDGHVATNEFENPIADEDGSIRHLDAFAGSRHLTWRVPKGLAKRCDLTSGNLSGCSPVITGGIVESENQRWEPEGKYYVVSLLKTRQVTISRCKRDLSGKSVIILDPRHLLTYDGRFRIVRLELLWKS
ncbi:MAG TPA: hypothetical protein VG944_20545 [Fimbriimonas sp.]|nr:hypothetical protein [Fimbriimonas sp.]